MTTPQNPGDGDTPQDPSNPQNPYGTPPPPPPPAAPVTPIPGAAPPYGEPTAPTPPPAAPAYGQPAYGQPAYAQPTYAQPGMTGPPQPGKGMAIAALVIGIFGCTIIGFLVAIPLAIIVLVRSRGGQNHGKGLAITAIIVSVISLAITVVGGIALGIYVNGLTDVNDLKPGDCITANGLTDAKADTIDTIRTVECTEKHDGEVLATTEVTAELADDFSQMDPQATCAPAIEAAGKTALVNEDINVTALTVPDPDAGDNIACVAYRVDGKSLTSKLGS